MRLKKDLLLDRDNYLKMIQSDSNPININPERIINAIHCGRLVEHSILEFFQKCKTSDNANIYQNDCLRIMQALTETNNSDIPLYDDILNQFNTRILPCVKNLNSINNSILNRVHNAQIIKESIEEFKHCDRILNNLKIGIKKSDILNEMSKFITSYSKPSLETFCSCIYDVVDDYKISTGKRLNIALEYAIYGAMKFGLDFSSGEILNEMVDHYSLSIHTEDDKMDIYNIASKNVLLEETDISEIFYLFESEDYAESKDIEELIKSFKKQTKKDVPALRRLLSSIYSKTPESIIDSYPRILEIFRISFVIGTTVAINPILALLVGCVDQGIALKFKLEDTKRMLKYFNKELEKVEDKMYKLDSDSTEYKRLESYSKKLQVCIDKIQEYYDSIHHEIDEENPDDVSQLLDEHALDQEVEKIKFNEFYRMYDFYKNQFRILADIVTSEVKGAICYGYPLKCELTFNNIPRHLSFNGRLCIPFVTCDIAEKDQVINVIQRMINSGNTQFDYIYSIITPFKNENNFKSHFVAFYLVPKFEILDIEPDPSPRTLQVIQFYLDIVNKQIELIDKIDDVRDELSDLRTYERDTLDTGIDMIDRALDNLNLEIINSIGDDIDIMEIEDAIDECVTLLEDVTIRVNKQEPGKEPEEVFKYMNRKAKRTAMEKEKNDENNKNSKKDKTKDGKNDNGKKKNFKEKMEEKKIEKAKRKKERTYKRAYKVSAAIDKTIIGMDKALNKIDIATTSLKKGLKSLSYKERELSRNLDANANAIRNSIERSLTNDNREAIIKGSIIPSFSKLIKNGIIFSGTFAVNPVVACIGAIGALAMSKKISDKERQLLMDEIEVELKVIDKAIDEAKDNDINKYRQLLLYERKLQREAQRLKYGIGVSVRKNPAPVLDSDD